jgi:hypothetical protein
MPVNFKISLTFLFQAIVVNSGQQPLGTDTGIGTHIRGTTLFPQALKSLLGPFYTPDLVLAPQRTLITLPEPT